MGSGKDGALYKSSRGQERQPVPRLLLLERQQVDRQRQQGRQRLERQRSVRSARQLTSFFRPMWRKFLLRGYDTNHLTFSQLHLKARK